MKIIAWGPPNTLRPTIPTALYVDRADETVRIWRANLAPPDRVVLEDHISSGMAEKLEAELDPGYWICLENDGPVPFPAQQEQEWRKTRAQYAVHELVTNPPRDPLKKLEIVKAAADLLNVPIADIARHAFMAQRPGESLEQVLRRMRAEKTKP